MTLRSGKPIRQVAPPALPQPVRGEYSPLWQDQFNNVLRLYFNQLTNVTNALIDSNSGGAALFKPHGIFRSGVTQTLSAPDTATLVSFELPPTPQEQSAISINSVAKTDIQVDFTGVYQIRVDLQINSTNSSSKDVTVWMRKNGVDIPLSARQINFSKAGSDSFKYLVTIEMLASDVMQVVWASTSANTELRYSAPSAPYPAIPSAIVSIAHLSNVLLE